MKIAYLILAHRNPRVIKKTVEILSCDDASFFIHIDAKFALAPFDLIRGRNVFLIEKRIPVYWGEFSVTEAMFLLIQAALAAPQHFDYFVLLSGSDFPLRSGRYIRDFFKLNKGKEFITMVKLPAPGMPISRINTLRFPSTRPVLRFIFRVLAKFGLAQRDCRKYLKNLEPYSGHQWWALSREACQYVIEFRRNNLWLEDYFENTHASDETFIQTILGNSPFKSQMRRHLVFEDWHSPAHHPEMINAEHVKLFEAQEKFSPKDSHGEGEKLFARKFSDDDLHLVERIAEMIDKKEKLPKLNAH